MELGDELSEALPRANSPELLAMCLSFKVCMQRNGGPWTHQVPSCIPEPGGVVCHTPPYESLLPKAATHQHVASSHTPGVPASDTK